MVNKYNTQDNAACVQSPKLLSLITSLSALMLQVKRERARDLKARRVGPASRCSGGCLFAPQRIPCIARPVHSAPAWVVTIVCRDGNEHGWQTRAGQKETTWK